MKKTVLFCLALVLAGGLTMLWSAQQAQRAVADKLVRLHVLANSDSAADQALKLEVRDTVLEAAEEILAGCRTRAEAEAQLRRQLAMLEQAAGARLEQLGSSYEVTAQLSEEVYPRREYESFSLPAGEYLSLRLVIGEGTGKNWWCVVFPPLCLAAVSEDVAEQAEAAGFSREEVALITGESGKTQIRFKLLDWLAKRRG